MPFAPLKNYHPKDAPVAVLYHDDHIVVVDKPSGLLSVAGKSEELADCMHARVRREFAGAMVIHRLDMDTSGVMIFARRKSAQRHLNLQFEQRRPQKTYVARVMGAVGGEAGQIDLPLMGDWPNRPLQKVDHDAGKPAQTDWRVLSREQGATRVELHPKTGRTHQLRVHMLAIGHPILGDRFYGDQRVIDAADRLQLHAHRLFLDHPDTGAALEFCASVPF
ncbi:RNA pseudouridine synthase [Amylibacter marinus]|uniref:Pseudouridine synthase n=1 Tax=Amylibacter marinus TaxID=1475483 RepID=A0ABQ5VWB5_9RHOB|nr:RluA family pseudouridine synthase [Amylibacter marinus]GLQ35705.1 RNA pseudouridine synthase [Amylibacter marinus]